MKTVGIIGGFGPETTVTFMMQLVSMWAKQKPGFRPEIILWHAPVNEIHEAEFISTKKHSVEFNNLIIMGAKKLEQAGADFLVLPCNSLHIFIKSLRRSVNIPVLSIIELTSEELLRRRLNEIGILSTTATRKSKIFDNELRKNNIKLIKLSTKNQKILDNIIKNLVTNSHSKSDLVFRQLVSDLKKSHAKQILLACTDLQLIPGVKDNKLFIDTLEILADKTIEQISTNKQ